MKLTKALCALLCIVTATCFTAACAGNGEPEHTHTFETEWTMTETEHYKKATCEHTDERDGYGVHVYGTGDKENECTVCGYVKIVVPDEPDGPDIPDNPVFDGVTESAPNENIISLSARSNSKLATSVWQTAFGQSAFEITVWVRDEVVVTSEDGENSDGVKIYLSEVSPVKGYVANKTVSIAVSPDGEYEFKKADTDGNLSACAEEISVAAKQWAENGESVIGYKVTVSVPYAVMGTTAAQAKGNISMAAELYNTASASFKSTVRAYSLTEFGTDVENQNTYMVVEDDNTYALNSEPYPTGTFHYKSDIYSVTNSFWDLSKDYLESEPDYADREVALTGTLGTGKYNELYFYKLSGTLFYCEAAFTLPQNPVHLGDDLPKWGISIVDESKNGIFFYFDAIANKTTGAVTAIPNFGYVPMRNGAFKWENASSTPSGISAGDTVKLAMFRDGGTFKLLADGKLLFTLDGSSGINSDTAAVPSIFSFNTSLKLTDYRATTDENDEEIKKLSQKLPEYTGGFAADYEVLDSSNYQLNLTEYGGLDWAYLKGQTNPEELKNTSKRYIAEFIAANKDVGVITDLFYGNSSLSWTDGTYKTSNTLNGEIAGLKFDGDGAKLLTKLNVYADTDVTYYMWFGGYEAETVVKVYDSHGKVLYNETVGSYNGRTLGRLALTLSPVTDTQITVEMTAKASGEQPFPQLWALAASAINTADIPADPSEIAVKGTVEAEIVGGLRTQADINLTLLGTKDWIHYTKEGNAVTSVQKYGGNGYFGKLTCLANVNGMDDFFDGTNVKLTYTDGTPVSSETYTGKVPALALFGGGQLIQELYVKAGEPVRFMIWASAWTGDGVAVNLYDSEKVWYTGSIASGRTVMIDITVESSEDACLKLELSTSDQIWFLGGAAGEPLIKTAPSETQFAGNVKTRFTAGLRSEMQINLTDAKDFKVFPLYNPLYGFEGTQNGGYFGELNTENNVAYPFADFATTNSLLTYSGGKIYGDNTVSGNVPALSLYGDGAKMTLALNVKGSSEYSYFLWLGGFNSVMTVDLKTGGASVLSAPITVGTGTGATVGCLRLDLTNVNESVLYLEMTCSGQEIWLCAAMAGETPVDPEVAFDGNLKIKASEADRFNTSLNMTEIGTYDWVVYQTDYKNPARKDTDKPVIGDTQIKFPDWDVATSMGDFFYENQGTISWTDGNAGHETMSQSGNFPALTSVLGYRISYSVPEGFKGTVTLWVGYWETIAEMKVTDIDGNLLDVVRVGDVGMGKLYCIKIDVDSLTKTKLFIDFDTYESGKTRSLWLFGTAVGAYDGNTSATEFSGNIKFEGQKFDRENYSLDMTEKGTLDWVVYDNGSATDFESKNTHADNSYIGALTLGAHTEISKEENYFYNNSGLISWSDGTKQTSFTSAAGSAFPGIQAGFKTASFTVALKAEAGKSIKYSVYTGGWRGYVGMIAYDENNAVALSQTFGTMQDGIDNLCIDVTVTSEVDTVIYVKIYKITSPDTASMLDGANLMLMGIAASYEEASAA